VARRYFLEKRSKAQDAEREFGEPDGKKAVGVHATYRLADRSTGGSHGDRELLSRATVPRCGTGLGYQIDNDQWVHGHLPLAN
jgi:hypothetical protein